MTGVTPETADAPAIAAFAAFYRLSGDQAAKRWAGAMENIRVHFREVAQAAIAAQQ